MSEEVVKKYYYLVHDNKNGLYIIVDEEDLGTEACKNCKRNDPITAWHKEILVNGIFIFKAEDRQDVIAVKRTLEGNKPHRELEHEKPEKNAMKEKDANHPEFESDGEREEKIKSPEKKDDKKRKKNDEKKNNEKKKSAQQPSTSKKQKVADKEESVVSDDEKENEVRIDSDPEYVDSDDENVDDQLYGADFEKDMKELRFTNKPATGIFCRFNNYNQKTKVHRATSYARKLLSGVIKMHFIVKGTRSGQSCHSMAEYKNKSVVQLHPKAIETITEFAIAVGKAKNWDPATRREVGEAISAEIVDLKSKFKQGKIKLSDYEKKIDEDDVNQEK